MQLALKTKNILKVGCIKLSPFQAYLFQASTLEILSFHIPTTVGVPTNGIGR